MCAGKTPYLANAWTMGLRKRTTVGDTNQEVLKNQTYNRIERSLPLRDFRARVLTKTWCPL